MQDSRWKGGKNLENYDPGVNIIVNKSVVLGSNPEGGTVVIA